MNTSTLTSTPASSTSSSAWSPRPGARALLLGLVALAGLAAACEQDPLADALIPIDCASCHGSPLGENAAPPGSIRGDGETTDRGVGAHQAHMRDGEVRLGIACDECHVVPELIDEPGHVDAWPAEVAFGELATAAQSAPLWEPDGGFRCSNVYCHGATLEGGLHTTPVWTTVDGTQSACDSCHGAPPPEPHPTLTTCDTCHPQTVLRDGTIDVEGGFHINGKVEPEEGCEGCHGNEENPAPPMATDGSTDTTDIVVGAHQSHLTKQSIAGPVDCAECHIEPTEIGEEGHLDEPPAEVTWGPLAMTAGLSPAWDRETATCANTYCHGATLEGGSNTTPTWTVVDDTQAACGTCHGNPPPLPHPQKEACQECHAGTVSDDGTIDVAGGFHIDGELQHETTCTSCHGTEESGPAPPVDVAGNTDTASVGVGAHQTHLVAGTYRAALACVECHIEPEELEDEGHYDALPAELTWGVLATTEGVLPEWEPDTATCANVYCHGATLSDGAVEAPVWTSIEGPEAECGSCHGLPPGAPHPHLATCMTCHPDTLVDDKKIDVDGGLHINGTVETEIPEDCETCHDGLLLTGSHAAHFGSTIDTATYGGLGVSSELLPEGSGYAFDCGNCHPVDVEQHMNGVRNAGGGDAEIDLSPIGAPAGSLRALNADWATYVPGSIVLTDDAGMTYTEGYCTGVYCHSFKDVRVPGPVPVPGTDFPAPTYPIVYPPFEVNISRGYNPTPLWGSEKSECGDCHGFPPRTFADEVEAGAGDSHSWINPWGEENLHGWNKQSWPLPCATCHNETVSDPGVVSRDPATFWSVYQPVPIASTWNHVNGKPDVTFTSGPVITISIQDLTGATYDEATKSCSDVVCHENNNPVTWGTPYRYENTEECNVCHHK